VLYLINKEANMPKLTIVPSIPVEEEIRDRVQEIDMPGFDIIPYEEDTWFEDMIEEQEDAIRRIVEQNRGLDN